MGDLWAAEEVLPVGVLGCALGTLSVVETRAFKVEGEEAVS